MWARQTRVQHASAISAGRQKNMRRRRYRRAWVSVSTVRHTTDSCHNCHGKSAVVFHVLPSWSETDTRPYLWLVPIQLQHSAGMSVQNNRRNRPHSWVLQVRSLIAPSRAVLSTSDIGSSAGALLRASSSILVYGRAERRGLKGTEPVAGAATQARALH